MFTGPHTSSSRRSWLPTSSRRLAERRLVRKSHGGLWENVKSLGGAILIYLVIKTFLFEAFRIPSGSMIPTLLVGDWLFVNKAIYGAHVPFTSTHLPAFSEPKRGEVVVFTSPPQSDQPEDPTPTLVKRLVGMPGDTLHMRAGMLYVNGIAQRQGFGAESQPGANSSQPDETHPLFDWQHAIELKQSRFGGAPAVPTHDNWGPLVIPAAHVLHDGRRSLRLEGQPILGSRTPRQHPRTAFVRLLLVPSRRQRSAAPVPHRHPVGSHRDAYPLASARVALDDVIARRATQSQLAVDRPLAARLRGAVRRAAHPPWERPAQRSAPRSSSRAPRSPARRSPSPPRRAGRSASCSAPSRCSRCLAAFGELGDNHRAATPGVPGRCRRRRASSSPSPIAALNAPARPVRHLCARPRATRRRRRCRTACPPSRR